MQERAGSELPESPSNRLDALDGLRALAVLAVALFHYYHFWTPSGAGLPLVAYGDAYASLPLVGSGYLGVHLFFAISGFVILLTLQRTRTIAEFAVRRAIRLWPALVVFGTATFVIVGFFGPKELQVGWWEYGLSLLVLPPQHVAMLLNTSSWHWLDGAYWSLFVEIKFYCIVAIIYFAAGRNFVRAWIGFEVLTIAVGLVRFSNGGPLWDMIDGFFFQAYVPYFSFGMAAYLVWSGRHSRTVGFLIVLSLFHAALVSAMELATYPKPTILGNAEYVLGQIAIFAVFSLLASRRLALSMCRWPPLVRMGRASYGIYLVHQSVGVTILSAPVFASGVIALLGPILVIGAITVVAVIVFETLESPVQAWLKRHLIEAVPPREPMQGANASFVAERRAVASSP